MESLPRYLAGAVQASLQNSHVVFLQGAGQTGKSTLARSVAANNAGYLTQGITEPVVIDEVQRVPALALAIKAAVDSDPRPGRFLLTGSADFMVLPISWFCPSLPIHSRGAWRSTPCGLSPKRL